MSHLSKRLVGIAASTVLLSLVSTAANAQATNVLTLGRQFENRSDSQISITTQHTFSSSMILNSIGFVASQNTLGVFNYYITRKGFYSVELEDPSLDLVDNNGIRWYTLPTPMTLIATDIVEVYTLRTHSYNYDGETGDEFSETALRVYSSVNPSANVVFTGVPNVWGGTELLTNSNLRVSNPGSNVAPEPGTFALALTGGGALLGICIRRRRNAA